MAGDDMRNDATTGRCLCGRIVFTAHGPPLWVTHCHCNSCRRSTGAPITTFVGYDAHQVEFIGDRKFFASSPDVRRGFCGDCGTPLTYESAHTGTEVHFYVSVMDEPDAFRPTAHVYYRDHIKWLELNDDLPRFETFDRHAPPSRGPRYQESP